MNKLMASIVMIMGVSLAACSASLAVRDATSYQADTRTVLMSHNNQVKACYDQALAQDQSTTGTVVVNFKVKAESGDIYDTEVNQDETTAPTSLSQCVLRTLDGLKLDPPDKNEGHASFRWDFNPRG